MVIGRPWPKRLFSSQIRTALSAKAVAGCDMMRAWAPKLPGRGCASSNTTARGRKLRVQVGIAGEQEGPGVRGVAVAGLGRRRPPAAWRLLHLKGPHAAESVNGPARRGCGAVGIPQGHASRTPRRAGQPVGRGMVGLPDGVLAGRVFDDRHAAGGSGQRRLRHRPVNGWLVSGGRGQPAWAGRAAFRASCMAWCMMAKTSASWPTHAPGCQSAVPIPSRDPLRPLVRRTEPATCYGGRLGVGQRAAQHRLFATVMVAQ